MVKPKKRRGHHAPPVPDSPCDRAPQYYHGAAQLGAGPATAIPVTVGSDHAMGNLVYQLGGIITGHVDLPANPQRSDGIVTVRKFHSHQAHSARVDDDGNYTVHGLGAGSYRVTFARVSGFAVSAAEFYNNHPESAGVGSANLVDLTAGETETRNATLTPGGHITGTADRHPRPRPALPRPGVHDRRVAGDPRRTSASRRRTARSTSAGSPPASTSCGWCPCRTYGCHSGRQFLHGSGGPLITPGPGTAVSVTQGGTRALSQPLAYARKPRLHNLVPPSIAGSPVVGSVLTASPGTWSESGVTFAYQWRADGTKIAGAAQPTLALTAAQLGRRITVLVTATKTGFVRRSKISPAVGPVAAATVVNPPPPPPSPPGLLAFVLAHKASFKGTRQGRRGAQGRRRSDHARGHHGDLPVAAQRQGDQEGGQGEVQAHEVRRRQERSAYGSPT